MKKLLLCLLPALLLTACKDPEDENVTNAKSLVGTYDCSRKGSIGYEDPSHNKPSFSSSIDYSNDAIITYLGDNRIQLDMGGVFSGSVCEYNGSTNAIVFDTYTVSDSSELLSATFNINIHGYYNFDYTDNVMKIHLDETYSGIALGPNVTYTMTGIGHTTLKTKK